ncbi:MAG: hypothetical protein KKE02_08585 [Alphaproteobacteria bacterium]|nr:hypothetical protein [Alphaproteobacteria bacterium]MBU1513551.1 hypothetical protein [Alphaproteobacteria bacterium]MBU2094804.1 hypothetical protein [Alphaproteobacteria bacterium]MBU2151061.1 hypothetical protein [Alphaproteobacteria bacterium]MBU2309344.1 hypothetical protein [Alphaproteobacteria bacterium]
MRFAGRQAEVAVQTGFIELSGDRLIVRGRRHPLDVVPGQVTTAVVHVQIDPRRRLVWTPARETQVAQAVLRLARRPGVRRLQVDFEVRASERAVLLAVLQGVRAGLPEGTQFSMTALASWCETETWLDDAPVDEIVPMLFRMGPGGEPLKAKLAAGGDFANPRCRQALAISTDTPLKNAPAGRRVYLFSPRSWTAASFETTRDRVAAWPVG